MEYRRRDLLPPENHLGYSLDDLYYDQSLESALSRLNLSTPTRQSPFPAMSGLAGSVAGAGVGVGVGGGGGGGSMIRNNPYMGSSNGVGFPSFSYQQGQQASSIDLQRMRIESAVKGQMGFYMPPSGVPFVGNENLGDLNLPWSNSDALTDHKLGYLQNWPYSDFQCNGKSINGFGLENSETLMSSLNNDHQGQSLNYSSLEELRGKILMVAKDHNGRRFLQGKIEERKTQEIEMVFVELEDHFSELMVHRSGNFVIQSLVEVCNEEQINIILFSVINDKERLMAICVDMHGTRCIQKLLEHLTNRDQISLVVSVLRPFAITLSKNVNGHHVIQHCMKFFTYDDNKHLLNEVANCCLDLATNKSGCCVLQQALARAQAEHKEERLVAEIIANALVLSENPYGNYVVQYILGMKVPHYTAEILAQLAGSFVSLSLNKFGSNVVERCFNECTEEQSTRIIREIISSPNFLMILQDFYGNYVAQSALVTSKGATRNALINLIQIHYPFLHSHPHGKRVLARTRRIKRHM